MTNKIKEIFVPGTQKLEVLCSETQKSYKGSILCVHGICHGAWCFEKFINYFSDNGYNCYALSLRGHGKSEGYNNINNYNLSDYSNDIKKSI